MTIRRTDNGDGLSAVIPTEQTESSTPQKQKQKGVGRFAGQPVNTKDGREQITFKMPTATIELLRRYSYWERIEQWRVVDAALTEYLNTYQKEHGELSAIPER